MEPVTLALVFLAVAGVLVVTANFVQTKSKHHVAINAAEGNFWIAVFVMSLYTASVVFTAGLVGFAVVSAVAIPCMVCGYACCRIVDNVNALMLGEDDFQGAEECPA